MDNILINYSMKNYNHLLYLVLLSLFSCANVDEEIVAQLSTSQVNKLFSLSHKMKDSIEIIAHRGASFYEPENSIIAFEKAFELYADAIELDLWISKDDSLMVFHDHNTMRITGENYNIFDTNSNILRTLNIGKGEKMPFLNEVLELLPQGKKLYLDIKWIQIQSNRNNPKVIDNLINQIEKSNRTNDVIIICFDAGYLNQIKNKKQDLKCIWIAHELNTKTQINDNLSKFNFDGLFSHWLIINSELSMSIKNLNKSLFAWPVYDTQKAVELYKNHKINGIVTNRPGFTRLAFEDYFK